MAFNAAGLNATPFTNSFSQVQSTATQLTAGMGEQLLSRAAGATSSNDAIIAIVDRQGNILGVRVEAGVAPMDQATRIFAIDGATITRVGGTTIDGGWNHQMLVSGDRIFVFTTADVWALPAVFAAESTDQIVESQTPSSIITEIDISDPSNPNVLSTLKVDGAYLSARAIDGTMRVVVSSYPADLPFVYPSGPAAEQIAEESNRRVIEQSTVEDWLPSYSLARGGEIVETGLMTDCERVHFPAEFSGFATLSVLTIDMDAGPTGGNAAAVVADGETIYASTESLYVATSVWVPGELVGDSSLRELNESWSTSIHRFDISGNSPAEYLASGSVNGHLLNQFSMDEYDGRLRVAVTEGPPWGFDEQSESAVVVMNRDGDRLVEVGRVGELGRGERIFSVRFVGEVAYVVTFRQVDPLYVIDLSDPTSPVVAAELKIPGYSSYLHPMGDGRVLGIGQDATEEGFTTGTKVSLFDVSDPANPIEVDVWTMPDGYSDAEWDHLAFLYWAPTETAVLPVTIWQEGFAGAVVLGTDDGLRERGRIAHDPEEIEPIDSGCELIPGSDLTEWINDEGVTVQVCGGDDPGGATGKYCEAWYPEHVDELRFEFLTEDAEVELADDDRVEVCWPNYELQAEPIRRSLVIGNTVWTITYNTIQGNDLATLEVTDIASL
ncbi:beta-propeller domain-containing protein [bacterium]|nr:beta-propeller domain-containing protein [bacterium]